MLESDLEHGFHRLGIAFGAHPDEPAQRHLQRGQRQRLAILSYSHRPVKFLANHLGKSCCASRLLAGNQGTPAASEAIQNDVATFGAIQDRVSDQIYRLAGWMHGKLGGPVVSKRVSSRILPDVRSRSAVLAEFKVV